ncbi:MAG: nucleotide-binding protein [Rhodomicrobium sp.]
MASRPTNANSRQPTHLTPDEAHTGKERLAKVLEKVRQFQPTSVTDQYNIPEVDKLSAAIDEALVRTFGAGSLDYKRYSRASSFNNGPFNYAYQVPISSVHQSLERSKAKNIALLEQAIEGLTELTEAAAPSTNETPTRDHVSNRKVFVVHGHEKGPREEAARFLERLNFEPIILHEQVNKGRTIIEKFEAHADVGFAVVLLTPDDVGGPKGGEQNFRARQNVVLELGYFIGKLGRERVCVLKSGELELPSDVLGFVWTRLDTHGAWRFLLAKELKAAGYELDLNEVAR